MALTICVPGHRRQRGVGSADRWYLLAVAFMVAACSGAEPQPRAIASGEWLPFEGSWNGLGSRHSIALGADRTGAIVDLKGTMLLKGANRPGVGFQAELIGLADSASGFQGRSVWTDERGDQVFSELQGEGTAARNQIAGTILSGTGRYAGVTGSYAFSWQWVMEGEEGAVQGRAVDWQGRVRVPPSAGESPR
jgi:hypothetical protein